MSRYQNSIKGVMIGVGAVFSMYAGVNPRAPYWIQQVGLEWLYRLLQEPRRLWRRYGTTIPPFLYLAAKQLIVPYKKKLSEARWRSTRKNITVSLEAMEAPYEKLGTILVRQNLVSKVCLEKALISQRQESNLKLGEILVRQGSLSRSQLKFYLKNQNMRFSDFLADKKILNQRSLRSIISLKNSTNKEIGEIILEQKVLSEKRLKELFVEYYTRRKGLFLADRENR